MLEHLGKIIVFVAVLSVLFLCIAFYISRTKLQNHAFFASYAVMVIEFFYKPLLGLYIFIYKSPNKLHKKMAELKNTAQRKKFSKTEKRIILAPHCMRHPDCKARTTRTGIQCTSCGKCDFSKIKELAGAYGYQLYIITGSSLVKSILTHPEAAGTDGVLAIGCHYEINKGMREMKRKKIMSYGIPLLSNGCYNTSIDLEEFERQLIYFKGN